MTPMRHRFNRTDLTLFFCALVGIVIYYAALPSQHPDSAAGFVLQPREIRLKSDSMLQRRGFSTEGLEASALPMRNVAFLDTLQKSLGRPGAIRWMREENRGPVVPYFWRVRWKATRGGALALSSERVTIDLTPDGQMMGFHRPDDAEKTAVVDRAALASLRNDSSAADSVRTLDAVSDSVLNTVLSFSLEDRSRNTGVRHDAGLFFEALTSNAAARLTTVRLGKPEAERLARYHLKSTAFEHARLQVDSIYVLTDPADGSARVRYRLASVAAGYEPVVEVDVWPNGGLKRLEVTPATGDLEDARRSDSDAGPNADSEDTSNISFSFDSEDFADVMMFVVFIAILAVAFVLFFRRLSHRLIDTGSAMRDALLAGVLMLILMGLILMRDLVQEDLGEGYLMAVLMTGIIALISAAVTALGVFVLSSVSESVGRETWPEKLEALSLARQGHLKTVPVGLALLRGAAASQVLVGIVMVLMVLLPGARMKFAEGGNFFAGGGNSEILFTLTARGVATLIVALGGVLLMGSLAYRHKRRPLLVVTVVILLFSLSRISFFSIRPAEFEWLFGAVAGLVVVATFCRYEWLTAFVALLLAGIQVDLTAGALSLDSPIIVDLLAAPALLLITVALGIRGVASGRTAEQIAPYVPSYVREMAQQERLQRELELAHQVQEAFLPRKMPRMEGLDIAAICLPAQEVGGDYYDFVELGRGRLAVVVGDVSGKGIQAAFYMTLTKGILKTLCTTVASPAQLLQQLNALFLQNAPRGMFISMIYGVIDVEARTFSFARAGHNPVILKRSPAHGAEAMLPTGMAIGLAPGDRFDLSIEEKVVPLSDGDVLVLYTDGFSEARNVQQEEYGDDRLAERVGRIGNYSAPEILREVADDVHRFVDTAERHDDMTMVVIKIGHRIEAFADLEPEMNRFEE